jgi:hypothetical protein
MNSLRINVPKQSSRLNPRPVPKPKPIESLEQIMTHTPVSKFNQTILQEFANSMETMDMVDMWIINTQSTMKELESPDSPINRINEPEYHRMAIARYNQIFKVLIFLKHNWPNKTLPMIP